MPLANTMPAEVFAGFQAKKETTPGTLVAATERYRSFKLGESEPVGNVEEYESAGSIVSANYVRGLQDTNTPFDGFLAFYEDVLTFNAAHGEATATTPSGGTNSRSRVWQMNPTTRYNPMAFSLERNDGIESEKYAYSFVNGYAIKFSPQRITKSGKIMSRSILRPATSASSVSTTFDLSEVPPFGYIKFADTYAGLAGASKTRIAMEGEFQYDSIFEPVHPFVDDNRSFDAIVQVKPKVSLMLSLIRTTGGTAYVDTLESGAKKYIEIGCLGALIEGSIYHSFTLQMAGKIGELWKPRNNGGLRLIDFTFKPQEQSDMASPVKIELVNTLT